MKPHLRSATLHDAPTISQLVQSHSPLQPGMPDADGFLASISEAAFQTRLTESDYYFAVVEQDHALLGVIALRQPDRIAFFFVAKGWQGQGLGRLMWDHVREYALAHGNPGEFLVNSDVNAIAVYLRLGFVINGEQVAPNGVAFVPMQLKLAMAK